MTLYVTCVIRLMSQFKSINWEVIAIEEHTTGLFWISDTGTSSYSVTLAERYFFCVNTFLYILCLKIRGFVWSGFIWLTVGLLEGLCEYSNALLCSTNVSKFLALLMHQAVSKVSVIPYSVNWHASSTIQIQGWDQVSLWDSLWAQMWQVLLSFNFHHFYHLSHYIDYS